MTNQEYTFPVADATFTHTDAVLAIDEIMHRLGFQSDGQLVIRSEFTSVHAAMWALYAALESARATVPNLLHDPLAEAVAIAIAAAEEAGVLDELAADALNDVSDDDIDEEG